MTNLTDPIYFNEYDKLTAQWLSAIYPQANIDQRTIHDIGPDDVRGFTQCHFFGGIGGWQLALDLAGWPRSRSVWTGSCPCQPYSSAGKQKAQSDERHLWPVWFQLIRERHPECLFGEQVANAIGHGWLDGVFADLETEGYACGAVVLGAHSVGSPHIRQRLFWVADANEGRYDRRKDSTITCESPIANEIETGRTAGRLVDSNVRSLNRQQPGDSKSSPGNGWGIGGLVLTGQPRLEGLAGHGDDRHQPRWDGSQSNGSIAAAGVAGGMEHSTSDGRIERRAESGRGSVVGGCGTDAWSTFDIIPCRDGKARRVESGTFPLAHGVPARVGRLRGYGNAIVPQLAAVFIQAYLEIIESRKAHE